MNVLHVYFITFPSLYEYVLNKESNILYDLISCVVFFSPLYEEKYMLQIDTAHNNNSCFLLHLNKFANIFQRYCPCFIIYCSIERIRERILLFMGIGIIQFFLYKGPRSAPLLWSWVETTIGGDGGEMCWYVPILACAGAKSTKIVYRVLRAS